jgi:hypothetical protein
MAISQFVEYITVVKIITVCKNGRQKFEKTVPLSDQSRGPYAREHGNSNVISAVLVVPEANIVQKISLVQVHIGARAWRMFLRQRERDGTGQDGSLKCWCRRFPRLGHSILMI